MTGLEYMNTVCPTTSAGKDPNKEDVMDAFEDGIAEGYRQAEKQGETIETSILSLDINGRAMLLLALNDKYYFGDKVIVQIRKKETK